MQALESNIRQTRLSLSPSVSRGFQIGDESAIGSSIAYLHSTMSPRKRLADLSKSERFDSLCGNVQACRLCARMLGSQRVLSRAAGPIDATLMFVGEAPGRLGADTSGIPFHGDQAGHNFERLIGQVGLDRYSIFVTNAVLCNPKDSKGNNTPPSRKEIANCSDFLRRQVDLVSPKIIVSLGGTALAALDRIESHSLSLASHVRTANKWYGRVLIPAYHPGQRAMIHRSFANQLADYEFVSEHVRRGRKKRSVRSSALKEDVESVVRLILRNKPELSYFSLHKLFYLVELTAVRRFGQRATTGYIVRQKDGPYCTDLHYKRLQRTFPEMRFRNSGSRLMVSLDHLDMFGSGSSDHVTRLDGLEEVVRSVVDKYGQDNEKALKRSVYMTSPMRAILRAEKNEGLNLFNAPIDFSAEVKR